MLKLQNIDYEIGMLKCLVNYRNKENRKGSLKNKLIRIFENEVYFY